MLKQVLSKLLIDQLSLAIELKGQNFISLPVTTAGKIIVEM